jgi:hypothetical protein
MQTSEGNGAESMGSQDAQGFARVYYLQGGVRRYFGVGNNKGGGRGDGRGDGNIGSRDFLCVAGELSRRGTTQHGRTPVRSVRLAREGGGNDYISLLQLLRQGWRPPQMEQ